MNSFDLFGNSTSQQALTTAGQDESRTYTPTIQALEDEIDEGQAPVRHFWGVRLFLAITASLLAVQAYHLQVSNASSNRAAADGNSVRLLTVAADRGLIEDSNGQILAQNDRKLALAINPQTLPKLSKDREPVYALLSQKAGLSVEEIEGIKKTLKDTKTAEPFAIKTNLTKEESLLYEEWFAATPGIILQELPTRQYTDIPSIGQILGYVGRASDEQLQAGVSRVGKAGIEVQYNDILTGKPGVQRAEVNAQGDTVRLVPDQANSEPKAGATLRLSIDARLQQVVADALAREIERRTKKLGPMPKLGASAVVLDPKTGAVKAMVSLPDYKASLFAQGIGRTDYQQLLDNPANPLLNRAIQGSYAPGSTVKPVVASGGLQAGVIGPNTTVTTPEAITIGSFRFPDWKLHGLTNTRKAIAESNNIFFYAVGGGWAEGGIKGLGIDGLAANYSKFGFGTPTGIDLPSEVSGLVPTPAWKEQRIKERWYIGDTYQASIGQGFLLATPLQLARATAAIANGGTLYDPRVAWSTISADGTETLLPHPSKPLGVDAANLQVVREGMRQTVESGSGRPLNGLKVTSAGKTGTSQFGSQGLLNAWYVGFAPYENPQYVFAILIEGGGESFYSSVPVAEDILRGAFNEPLAPGQALFAHTNVPAEFTGER